MQGSVLRRPDRQAGQARVQGQARAALLLQGAGWDTSTTDGRRHPWNPGMLQQVTKSEFSHKHIYKSGKNETVEY